MDQSMDDGDPNTPKSKSDLNIEKARQIGMKMGVRTKLPIFEQIDVDEVGFPSFSAIFNRKMQKMPLFRAFY